MDTTEDAGRLASPLTEELGPMTDEQITAALAEVGAAWLMDEQDAHCQPNAMRHLAEVSEEAGCERCAKLCETWMEAAERQSGPEAAGWLHQMAQHMRGLRA